MAKITAGNLIQQINDMRGNITAVARRFGVSRTTIYKHINKYPTVKIALDEAREEMIDNAESVLYQQVLGGNMTAVIFFLKTQGKRRGYSERQELELLGDKTIGIRVEYSDDYTTPATPDSGNGYRQRRSLQRAGERAKVGKDTPGS